jgi:predicted glycosyltransferase involved in capsule biosynthesis
MSIWRLLSTTYSSVTVVNKAVFSFRGGGDSKFRGV